MLSTHVFIDMQANRAALAELKAFQEKVRLEDEVASEAIKEASRAYVEDVLEKGIASTKKRTRVRDHSEAVRVRALTACCASWLLYHVLQERRAVLSAACACATAVRAGIESVSMKGVSDLVSIALGQM